MGQTHSHVLWKDLGGAAYIVAASDAPISLRRRADVICDGTADEVQINAAITGGHKHIQLTPGSFTTAAPIDASADVHLMGAGIGVTTVTGPGGTVDFLEADDGSVVLEGMTVQTFEKVVDLATLTANVDHIVVRRVAADVTHSLVGEVTTSTSVVTRLEVDSCKVENAEYGVNVEMPFDYVLIKDSQFLDIDFRAVRLGKDTTALQSGWKQSVIRNNRIVGVGDGATTGDTYGILTYARYVLIDGNHIEDITSPNSGGQAAVGIYTKSFGVISNNYLLNAGYNEGQIVCKGTDDAATGVRGDKILIVNNHIEVDGSTDRFPASVNVYAMKLENARCVCRGNKIIGIPISSGSDDAIQTGTGARHLLLIEDNDFRSLACRTGINVGATTEADGQITIRNNIFSDCDAGASIQQALRFAASTTTDNVLIEGNVFATSASTGVSSEDTAILIKPTNQASNWIIRNNVFRGWNRGLRITAGGVAGMLAGNEFGSMGVAAGTIVSWAAEADVAGLVMMGNEGCLISEVTLATADATPSVADWRDGKFIVAGSTTITDFDDGVEQRPIWVRGNGSVQITHGTNIMLRGAASLIPTANQVIALQLRGTVWYEMGGEVGTPSDTTANLASVSATINTVGKYAGKVVWNTTTTAPVWAEGSAAADVWNDATGATAHSPV